MTHPGEMHWVAGLVSVTFRKLPPADVIRLAVDAGLRWIEWGADVHVPPGEPAKAKEVGRATREAGLEVVAYGSYDRLGERAPGDPGPKELIRAAVALGAPCIRVWAGRTASEQLDAAGRKRVIGDARQFARQAAEFGLDLVVEFHPNTLTDRGESAREFLEEVDEPNFKSLWQPNPYRDLEERLVSLRLILPWLVNVHVFHWTYKDGVLARQPLAEGVREWAAYLDLMRGREAYGNRPIGCLIEFVRGDEPARLHAEAKTLREWLAQPA